MMRASVWRSLVRIPHWDPVSETASHPSSLTAIESSAAVMRSPPVEQHVQLAPRWRRRQLLGQGDEIVGRLAHGGDDDHDVVAFGLARHDLASHIANLGGVGDRTAAVLLDDDGHGGFIPQPAPTVAYCVCSSGPGPDESRRRSGGRGVFGQWVPRPARPRLRRPAGERDAGRTGRLVGGRPSRAATARRSRGRHSRTPRS